MNGFSQTFTAQTNNGAWNTPGTWDTGTVPNSGNSSQIRIPSGFTVLVTSAVTISHLDVETGGTLQMSTGGSISSITNGITVQTGATYNHAQNGGTIPAATWQTGSTCKVTGATGTLPTGLTQNFYHFTWDCSGQTSGNFQFNGALTTVNGDLTIANTGATGVNNRRITLAVNGTGTSSCTVGGNFVVTGGSQVVLGNGGPYTMNVGQDVIFSSTNQSIGASGGTVPYTIQQSGATAAATSTMNVGRDFILNSGYLSLVGSAGTGTINITRDFTLNGGSVNKAAGAASVNFVGTGNHNYVLGTATFANSHAINYTVAAGGTLDLGASALGSTAGNFTNNGTIILRSTNPLGAIVGNIPIQNRFFPGNATVIYRGAAAQFMDSGQPTDGGATTIIDNASGVTLVGDVTIGGDLTLQNGNLALSIFRLALGGDFTPNSNVLDITGGGSSLEISGSGTFASLPLSGGTDIANFTLSRSGSTITLNNNLAVSGLLDHTDGTLELNGHTLTATGDYTGDFPAQLTSTAASSLIIDNAGNLPTSVHISGPMNTLTLNAQADPAVLDISASSFEVTNLNLGAGTLNNSADLNIAAGGTITRTHGTMSISPGGTGSYNLVYTNTNPITTDNEFPTDPARVNDVTVAGGGALTLSADQTINGVLALTAAGLDAANTTLTLHGNMVADAAGTFTSSTLVFAGNTTVSGSAIPELGNITVQNGATLNLPAELSVAGTFLVNTLGILNNNGGTVTLTGGAAQTVNANNAILYNLTVNNGGNNVALSSALRLAGTLVVESAGSAFASNGNLTLLSTSDGTTGNASIAPLLNGTSVTGNVIVQRYMSAEGRIFRYISSPVTNAPISQLQDDFPVTGNFTGTTPKSASGCSGCSKSPSMAYFDAATNAYVQYPVAANTEQLQPGLGYSAFIRDDNPFPGPGPITWDVTGPVNQGDISLPIVHRTGATTTWNMLGNPYPATVDWDDDNGWTRANVGSIAVRDNVAGVYLYRNNGVGDLTDGLIATGQSFWALTSGASPVLTIHEQAKSTTGTFYREGEKNVLSVKLSRGALWDRTFVRLDDNAVKGIDALDATKMSNDKFSFATRFASGETGRMAINSVNEIACGAELTLDLQFTKSGSAFVLNPAGSYTMEFSLLGSKFQPYKITLVDKLTGQRQIVSNNASVSITMTEDAASYAADRFKLVFDGPDVTLPTVGAPIVCDNGDATLVVENSQTDFEYYLLGANQAELSSSHAGNGSDLALTVPASALAQGANVINVGVRGFCGETTLNNTWQIVRQVVAAPAVTGASHCQPGSVSLSASGADASGDYRWYETVDATTSVGRGATFVTPELSKSDTYYASIVTTEGCEGARQPARAVVVLYDEVEITASGSDVLTSSYQTGNQWYFNEQPIAGATNPTYKAEKSGMYEVEVSVDGCSTRNTREYVVTGIEEVIASVSGYPNPTWKEINVSLKGSVQEINAIDVTSVTGQTVGQVRLQGSSQEKSGTMNVEQLLQGVYLMRIQLPTKTMVLKFVKQ
jgi:hypothetical protein